MSEQQKVGGHFQIISELSSGGFGQTFLAEDLRFSAKPKCVVKQLKPQSNEPEVISLAKRLFEQEVRILYQIGEHPQIPSIVTHFEEDNEFYFVQEYIEGNTFAQELSQAKIFSQRQVVGIVTELLEVLAFVHKQGVIHRDIKPSNLINRKSDGKTVLIDFGAVKQVRIQPINNQSETTKGTIAIGSEGYMPMEQLAGHPKFSSDVYAVGMFAIQLLTQTHPTQLRQNQRTGEWIWQDKASVNNVFADFLNQLIRYDFRQRFNDAVEALNYLKRINLNAGRNENPFWDQNEPFANKSDAGATQATFFSPAVARQEIHNANNQVNYQPIIVEPIFAQNAPPPQENPRAFNSSSNNLPNQNTQPLSRIIYPVQLGSERRVEAGNSTLGSLAFDGFGDSPIPKTLLYSVLILLGSFLVIFTAFSLLRTEYNDAQYIQSKEFWEGQQKVVPKPKESSGYMILAQKKEAIAETSEEWFIVAEEYKSAEEYYKKVEALATDDEERETAQKNKELCAKGKINALKRSENLVMKRR